VKYENYVNDPSKIYEKYKIISNMDEYLNYLNTMKNFQHVDYGSVENRDSYSRDRKTNNQNYRSQDNYVKKKRYSSSRDYKDLDEIENSKSSHIVSSNRNLISYDDL